MQPRYLDTAFSTICIVTRDKYTSISVLWGRLDGKMVGQVLWGATLNNQMLPICRDGSRGLPRPKCRISMAALLAVRLRGNSSLQCPPTGQFKPRT